MRIYYVLRSTLPNQKAHSVQIFNSSSALSKAGADVSLVVWNRSLAPGRSADPSKWPLGPDSYFGVERNFTLVTPREFQIRRLFGMERRARFMRGAIRHVRANMHQGDLVYTRTADVAKEMADAGIPVVLEMHDWKALEEPPCVALMKSNPPGSGGPFLGIVAISATLKRMLVDSGVPAEFITVAHDGIDPSRFADAMETDEARAVLLGEHFCLPEVELLLKPGRPVIGYCGHFQAGRGIEMLIECARRRPEWTFLFVGGLGNDVANFRDKASRLDIKNAIFTGYVSNTKLPPFLWACDVLTMPYEFAQGDSHFMSPMKMFEYMACGRAIISADWPQIREILADGRNALFHPRGDVDAMEKCIERAVGDAGLRDSLATQAREDVTEYSWQERGQKILAWLKERVSSRQSATDWSDPPESSAGPSLVYVTHMTYPSVAAHAIQISRTVSALSRLTNVHLVVKRMAGSVADAEKMYGLELRDHLAFIPCRSRFGMAGVAWLVWKTCMRIPGPFVFYTRSYVFAKHLISLRRWHGRRVFFESHKKMGYHKEDSVPDSEFNRERGAQEMENEPISLIKWIYKSSDCVFFLHEHSRRIAVSDLKLKKTVWNWYGINDAKPLPDREAKHDFIYSGSVSKGKLASLLLDAAARMKEPFSFHIYGRCNDATRKWLDAEIAARGLGASISYEGMLPFSELQKRLADYRFGVATMEGIKVIDYMENGLTLIIPRNASYEEVFSDDDVCYYRADDAADLARVMTACLATHESRRRVSAEVGEKFSLANRAQRIFNEMNSNTNPGGGVNA